MTVDSYSLAPSSKLPYITRFSYGVGHVFNDLCSSMWFSYLLVFFEKVLEFDSTKAGLILLVGQLADGFSTPIVGIFSDKENKIPGCAKYGRRKVWHLIGTIFVLVSFPFIFSPCLGCKDSDESVQLAYYCSFVVLFQFGWASVQISHLSLIPELTSKKHCRTELNSIRYAFTVLSSLTVYTVAFLFLGQSVDSENLDLEVDGMSFTYSSSSGSENSSITPDDADEFRNIALFCIGTGSFFSLIFHFGVKEPMYKDPSLKMTEVSRAKELGMGNNLVFHQMKKRDWFKEIAFYQVAILYMATRLYVNLYQVYIPLYVHDTLELSKTAIASVPFAMYLAGFFGSLIMKQVNRKIGRKGTFSLGCIIGIGGCVWIMFGESDAFKTWGVYCVAALLGVGGSTVLITSLSITADFIGHNVEGAAFVYGFMSLVDKISNGVVIMIIQSDSSPERYFYRNVLTYGCGSSCALGILAAISLIPIKVGERRGVSKKLAGRINEAAEIEDSDTRTETSEDKEGSPAIHNRGYRGSIISESLLDFV